MLEDDEFYFLRGSILAQEARYEEALEQFRMATKLNPQHAVAWFSMSSTLNELRRYEEALEAINKALELKPWWLEAGILKGAILGHLERYDEAFAFLDSLIERLPKIADELDKFVPEDNKDKEETLEHLAGVWYCKAIFLEKVGRQEEALECLEKALEIYPRFSHAWLEKGIILWKMNKEEEALSAIYMVFKHDPELFREFMQDILGSPEEK
ncbi:tetratricopeptide repeat protein [bacterium]|nr:tetratricopeptide repeat protein [bacterium]